MIMVKQKNKTLCSIFHKKYFVKDTHTYLTNTMFQHVESILNNTVNHRIGNEVTWILYKYGQ